MNERTNERTDLVVTNNSVERLVNKDPSKQGSIKMSDDWELKICCMGAGYVGGPTMAVIAKRCPKVRQSCRETFASMENDCAEQCRS
jgi:hypothetical protein